MSRGRLFDSGDPRLPPLIAAAVAAAGTIPVLRFAWHRLPVVRGWEADAIARSVVDGHGFSFPGNARWLWEQWTGDPHQYFPTAWVDPVYTYLLAGALWAFDKRAYLAIFALCFGCLLAIYACAYRLAGRFGGAWVGVLAVTLLAANRSFGRSFFGDITNAAFASCVMIVAVLLAVRYFEHSSVRRLIVAALGTGVLVLTCPAAQYYLIALTLALVILHFREHPQVFWRPLAFLMLAAAVIAPWTIRNYLTFNELVLVRNGAGQIAWDGTVGTAETFMPGAAQSELPAPWRSSGPRDAVQKMLDKDLRIQMHQYQVESMIATPPPGYEAMNEAQRDRLYLNRTREFIGENPATAARMALAKLEVFTMAYGPYGALLLALAIFGAALKLRDARSWPLAAAALCYIAPFVLIIAYYGRYRAPIEPVIGVLAAVGVSAGIFRFSPEIKR